ncbi:MAG TPA: Nramp family divalent metal transporter [Gaiellaceae bacterium]|nr:Nramp family divalent metal transporter [Gaiellaceae bacterium]
MSWRPGTGSDRDLIDEALPGEARVAEAARQSLHGQRRGLRALWPFLGPAFIASVAYIDPGNFATNITAGAEYGYLLLWVIVAANLMAMLVQTMSAKLGIATGLNLPEVCRERFSRPVSIGLWIQAELIAMATDLAELVGAALGLSLLFGIGLFEAGIVTGVVAFAILGLQTSRGFRHLEAVIVVLVGVIIAAFGYQVFHADASASGIASGFVPRFSGSESVLLAAGILGATVMPHVIYLHSALTQRRVVGTTADDRRRIARFERIDVVIAMTIAGLVNMSMLIVAAGVFHARGLTDIADLDEVYAALGQLVGPHADEIFGVALLASGLSSSSVGTLAGQVVMQGFIRRRIPLFVRRAVTMTPALVVLAIGVNPTDALVLSQVALSFGIPFALVPLTLFCRDRALMGSLVNARGTNIAAAVVTTFIVTLNVFLLYSTLF